MQNNGCIVHWALDSGARGWYQ